MPPDRAKTFLDMIRRAQRGRLKVYLGFAPGVGKTYQMLQEAHRLKADGVDVVIGVVEHHGRVETQRLIDGLERVPLRHTEYRGIVVEEMDLDGILARKPQVVLVDELAHTNAPGSRNAKRYEDVRTLVAAGIHVISAMNVQHLESLYDTVERLVSVKVRERVPDAVLAEADQVVNVDLAAEDLQRRLRDGKIYPQERVAVSLENFFTEANLEQLRELTLRELAGQLDLRRREQRPDALGATPTTEAQHADQIMVCLSSRGPNSARLLRFGSRLAGRLNRNWYAVYVQTPKEEPTAIDAGTQRLLGETLTLANQLGATVFTFKGTDVPDTILRFAREYRVGQIVIGSPHAIPWWKRVLLGRRSVAEELLIRQKDVTVVVVDAEAEDATAEPTAAGNTLDAYPQSPRKVTRPDQADAPPIQIVDMLRPDRVVIFNEPLRYRDAIRQLISAALRQAGPQPREELVARLIEEREERGSTLLNNGLALPHARVPGLTEPVAAIGLAKAGLFDCQEAIDVILLLLVPTEQSAIHLRTLAAAGRLFANTTRRERLATAATAEQVIDACTDGA